jgi:hypothetical protein
MMCFKPQLIIRFDHKGFSFHIFYYNHVVLKSTTSYFYRRLGNGRNDSNGFAEENGKSGWRTDSRFRSAEHFDRFCRFLGKIIPKIAKKNSLYTFPDLMQRKTIIAERLMREF